MKTFVLTILLLGLCGAVESADFDVTPDIDPAVEFLSIDYGDSTWMNPKYTRLLDRIYFLEMNQIPCCTVFVDKPCTVYSIRDIGYHVPLWMWFQWQEIDAIINDTNALSDWLRWQEIEAIVDSVLAEIE